MLWLEEIPRKWSGANQDTHAALVRSKRAGVEVGGSTEGRRFAEGEEIGLSGSPDSQVALPSHLLLHFNWDLGRQARKRA